MRATLLNRRGAQPTLAGRSHAGFAILVEVPSGASGGVLAPRGLVLIDLSASELVLHVVLGFVIGAFIGMTGIGGGVLVQPALIHLLGVAPVPAVGTGLAFAFLVKAGGVLSHIRLKTTCTRRAGLFLAGGVPGLLVSSVTINRLIRTLDSARVNEAVNVGIGSVIGLAAIVLALEAFMARGKADESLVPPATADRFQSRRPVLGIVAGAVTGALVGATSIAGGILTLPALILLLGAHPKQAVGTSILISLILAAIGGSVYFAGGNLLPRTALLMFVGGLPGVVFGSRITVRISVSYLRLILIIMVTLCSASFFTGRVF
jgi:uncharacterized membrane protein YfcA